MHRTLLTMLLTLGLALGQQKVPAEFLYHRVYAVVPMIGQGKKGDLKRPMFTQQDVESTPAERASTRPRTPRNGLIGYQMQISDDGKSALVEYVFATAQDARAFLDLKTPGVKTFDKKNSRKADIELEFRKVKKDFDLDKFQGLGAE